MNPIRLLSLLATAASLAACASGAKTAEFEPSPKPDPRVGLKPGVYDAGTAAWNMKLVSTTKPTQGFEGITNSDLAFDGQYAIQGSYNGYQVWDITDPMHPTLKVAFLCPASQSDVSVYKNLLFVSGEGTSGRLDCGAQGVRDSVSHDRLRGLRIFDITDITAPKYIANVQTCRGSHTHTVVPDLKDPDNVYVYISGSAGVRSPTELAGCSNLAPDKDPGSAHFRIEVIKVPLAHPEQAAIVSSPRIFNDLAAPPRHGEAIQDSMENLRVVDSARKAGGYIVNLFGQDRVLGPRFTAPMLDSIMKARGGTGTPSAADSAALHANIQQMINKRFGITGGPQIRTGPDQCHDITVYPAIGLAGGACEGYGLLLDIRDVAHPARIGAVSDSNFSYWHSATFNNDGTKIIFTDEWGGGGAPKCRDFDKPQWGADAVFTLVRDTMHFQNYYKMLAPQTKWENCVAHNGSLVPVPGRDIMVQAWYQGGVSVFDFTDPKHVREIAFFDRGPVDTTGQRGGGAWSSYWYNGVIVSSEIARGLDIFELTANPNLTQNELDAAKTVKLEFLNVQSQPKITWPASYALAGAYLDQLARTGGLSSSMITSARATLDKAKGMSDADRKASLEKLASELTAAAASAPEGGKIRSLADAVGQLGSMSGK